MEKQLPNNWVETKLENVVLYKKGKKPKVLKEEEFENSVPYLDIKAFEKDEIRRYADEESSNLIEEDDIGIVWDGARSGWVSTGKYGAIGSTLARLTPVKLSSVYLYRFLQSKYNFVNSNTRGIGIPHVDPSVLWDISFPLPPLKEQERIAQKLDALFAQLDDVKTRIETIPELLNKLRQAVLNQAVTGKLTKEWRKGKSLDSQYLINEIKKKRREVILKKDDKKVTYSTLDVPLNLPNEWLTTRLWDLSYLVTSGSRGWSKYYSDEGAYFVRSAEINRNYLRLDEAIFVDLPPKIEGRRSLIEKGDLLITITGANVGKCAYIESKIPESYVSQSVSLIKIVDKRISSFLHLVILSQIFGQNQIDEMTYGIGRPVLSLPQIKSITVPLPTIEEQTEIVKRVNTLFLKADQIEKSYQLLQQKVETMPQAIFQKAFKGELVEQLTTDGDAKKLLEEIKKLKEETKKAIKKTPKKEPEKKTSDKSLKKTKTSNSKIIFKDLSGTASDNLLAHLKYVFGKKKFTFSEIDFPAGFDYDEFRLALFNLLDRRDTDDLDINSIEMSLSNGQLYFQVV